MNAQLQVPLAIERLTVRADRVVCDVALAPDTPRFTTPTLMASVLATFPDLPRHACVNDQGDTFAAVMNRTALPHLLEHLVIDIQASAVAEASHSENASTIGSSFTCPTSPAVFVGTTEWTSEDAGRARIEVSFTDDLIALRAFREAIHFLGEAVVLCSA